MQKQILSELKELRLAISTLIGSSDLPTDEQFSKVALDKAAKEFKKLCIARGDWVPDSYISRYVKSAPWNAGSFIRKEFGFSNFFKQGNSYYYNRNDLIALSKELKERNINLARYIEYKQSKDNFNKKIASASTNKKATKMRKSYQLPDDLQDITTSDPPKPSIELILDDMKKLRDEFFQFKLSEYIDIYKGNFAMMKNDYMFLSYRNKELGSQCKKWCDRFNYANHALEAITNKKATFVPVRDEDMIQL